MRRNQKISAGAQIFMFCVLLAAIVMEDGFISDPDGYWVVYTPLAVLVLCGVFVPRSKYKG